MKVVGKAHINEIDRQAIQDYQIPGLLLMEHAAYSVFEAIQEQFKESKKIVIVCGPGNNGGDGLALARQLQIWSSNQVKVFLLAESSKLTEDGRVYYNICKQTGIKLNEGQDLEELEADLKVADIVVDALFGTGLTRKIEGLYAELIEKINESSAYIISVDMPSGIHADTGKVLGVAVKADLTLSFALPKIGICMYPGLLYAGKVKITTIGIPEDILADCPSALFTMDKETAKAYLPQRMVRSNKGTYGKVFIIGGQRGMSGAVSLAAGGCIRAGAGTVTVAVPESIGDILEMKSTESMTIYLPEKDGHISRDAVERIEELLPRYDVVAIGPGMGRSREQEELVKRVLESDKPCVIDADGLYALKPHLERLRQRKAQTVLTPHPGEMAYLMNQKIEDILEDPLACVRQFSKDYERVTLVLKLETTLVAGGKTISINTTGNNGLAKGGSGDVLTGIITALIGQKLTCPQAARLGVYLHGLIADKLRDEESVYSVTPTRVVEKLGEIFKEIFIYCGDLEYINYR